MAHAALLDVVRYFKKVLGPRAPGDDSDAALLGRFCHERDEAAFEQLFHRHYAMVLGVCGRILGAGADIEDALQATFLVLAHRAAAIRRVESVASWLHGVARRVALQAARRRGRDPVPPPPTPQARPEEELSRRESQCVLDEEVARLPERYRAAVVLCYLQGVTYEVAARTLHLPLGTLATRLTRAREILRTRLLRRGVSLAIAPVIAAVAAAPALAGQVAAAAVVIRAGGAGLDPLCSINVLTLFHTVVKSMFLTKLKSLCAACLASMVFLAGVCGLVLHALPTATPPTLSAAVPNPQNKLPPPAAGNVTASFDGEPTSLDGHTANVCSVAFSPDGRRLVTASGDSTVKVWDVSTGKEVLTLRGHTNQVWRVAIDKTGSHIASAGADGTIRLWNAADGKELRVIRGHDGNSIHALTFSPDGKRLASGNGAASGAITVKVWDVATGREELTLPPFRGMICGLAFSPDGRRLASVSGEHVLKVWDAQGGKQLISVSRPKNHFASVAFSPNGDRLLTANDDRTLTVWDAATGQELVNFKGHSREVTSGAFSPDGRLVASSAFDATVKVWDAATGKELDSRRGHVRETHCVAFDKDGTRLASCAADGTVKIWRLQRGVQPKMP